MDSFLIVLYGFIHNCDLLLEPKPLQQRISKNVVIENELF